jgi:hypothetical protein
VGEIRSHAFSAKRERHVDVLDNDGIAAFPVGNDGGLAGT